jgi:hypothetical protein
LPEAPAFAATVGYTQERESGLLDAIRMVPVPDRWKPSDSVKELRRLVALRFVGTTIIDDLTRDSFSVTNGFRSLGLRTTVVNKEQWRPQVQQGSTRCQVPRRNVLLEIARDIDECLRFLAVLSKPPYGLSGVRCWSLLHNYFTAVLAAIISSGLVRGYGRRAAEDVDGVSVPSQLYP